MTWDSEAEVYTDEMPSDLTALNRRQEVLAAVNAERQRQIEKWGIQSHPDGTGPRRMIFGHFASTLEELAKALCEVKGDWLSILLEEVFEAASEAEPVKLAAELDQVAAVCVAWREDILSRA